MSRPRFLRVETRPLGTVTYSELGPQDSDIFTASETASLDLGCTITRPDAHITDLIAYYDASQAERGQRALELVG